MEKHYTITFYKAISDQDLEQFDGSVSQYFADTWSGDVNEAIIEQLDYYTLTEQERCSIDTMIKQNFTSKQILINMLESFNPGDSVIKRSNIEAFTRSVFEYIYG